MIKLENFEVMGWEHAIRGMRNPMNSWENSDSTPPMNCVTCGVMRSADMPREQKDATCHYCRKYEGTIGPNDHALMMKLVDGGPVHAKFRRMITVYVDITAPLYWWKEFDTYKVGTVANSCSTMHKIHEKEFTLEDFSTEHLMNDEAFTFPLGGGWRGLDAIELFNANIEALNNARTRFLTTNDKKYWWQMIQLLPSSYNQKRTVMLSYEVLANMYTWRKLHKLDEWRTFCNWIEELPYSEIITGGLEGE